MHVGEAVYSISAETVPGHIFRNNCIENFHFALQRSDWLEHLREE